MEYDDLVKAFLDLKKQFEDHRHTGLDSLVVESTLSNQGALTAEDDSTVDNTYGSEEAAVIVNLRTRQAEIEAALIANGALE